MDQTALAYEQLIERFVNWAKTQEDIRAAIIIGSRARVNHPADEWSDLDIIIITTNPEHYETNADWVEHAGVPLLAFIEPTADGRSIERRVLYEGGLDVDFALAPVKTIQQMIEFAIPSNTADTIRRGVRVLFDKDDWVAQIQATKMEPPPPELPTQAEFFNVTNDFWYHTVWTAKHLRRGELWWGKSCCDGYMKERLRWMMAWHARATQGQDRDTWFRGRFLEEWADPRAVKALGAAFAHYDEADVWRALQVTMDLFRWLAVETAGRLSYPYPTLGDQRATELMQALHPRSTGN